MGHYPAESRKNDLLIPTGDRFRRLPFRGKTNDVFGRYRLAHSRQINQSLHHRRGPLDLLRGPAQHQHIAPQGNPHPERALQLHQIGVVHPREDEWVSALGRYPMLRFVCQNLPPPNLGYDRSKIDK